MVPYKFLMSKVGNRRRLVAGQIRTNQNASIRMQIKSWTSTIKPSRLGK